MGEMGDRLRSKLRGSMQRLRALTEPRFWMVDAWLLTYLHFTCRLWSHSYGTETCKHGPIREDSPDLTLTFLVDSSAECSTHHSKSTHGEKYFSMHEKNEKPANVISYGWKMYKGYSNVT